jgi:hypothetical protein
MTLPQIRLPAPEQYPPRAPQIRRVIVISAVIKPRDVFRAAYRVTCPRPTILTSKSETSLNAVWCNPPACPAVLQALRISRNAPALQTQHRDSRID